VLEARFIVPIVACFAQIPFLAGCGPSSPPAVPQPHAQREPASPPSTPVRVEDLAGTLFTPRPVVLALGANWQPREPAPGARFKGFATVTCLVSRAVSEPLVVELATRRSSPPVAASWDRQPVEVTTSWLSGRLKLLIPPDRLGVGLHLLELQCGELAEEREAIFDRITARIGPQVVQLDPRDPGASHVNSFLSQGVGSCSAAKMGGFVFEGPQEQDLPIRTEAPAVLAGVAENCAHQPARFRVEIGGTTHEETLGPRDRLPFRLPVPAGEVQLRFAVEGGPGYYLWGAPHLLEANAPPLPPIILVTLDTTRRDALSPYGAPTETTPGVDRFSRGATVYTHAVTTAPWTLPAHVSLFTGLYPSHHRVGVTRDRVPREAATLAELLRRRGYTTAGYAGGTLCSARFGLSLGFDHYRNPDGFETTAEPMTERVLEFVRTHADRPFFLFVNYFDPHQPYAAPMDAQARLRVADRAAPLADRPGWRDLVAGKPAAWAALNTGQLEPCEEGLEYVRATYLAEVAHMDQQLDRLLDELRAMGLLDRSLVILVGDHGELLGERGLYSHSYRLDPELTDIPLLVKWPGQTEGSRRDDLVSMVDLYPTILAAAGIDPPPSDGRPFGSGTEVARRQAVMEEHAGSVHPLRPPLRVADHLWGLRVDGRSHVVWDGGEEAWCEGPGGWHTCQAVADRDQVEATLRAILDTELDGLEEDTGRLTGDDRDALEALGYLLPSGATSDEGTPSPPP